MLNQEALNKQLKEGFSVIFKNAFETCLLNSFPNKSDIGAEYAKNFAETFDNLVSDELAILISTAIEFLGACLDQYEWGERNMSEKRFKLAVKELFDKKYHQYNNGGKFDLYSNLRCSLVHSSRPGNNIGLSEHKNNAVHLSNNGSLTLVFEDFLEDFKSACVKMISLIDNKTVNHAKVYNHVIFVPQD
jgi:hypothetical protein